MTTPPHVLIRPCIETREVTTTRDYVNVAELKFASGEYALSRSNAKDYLVSQPDPYTNSAGIIAKFYLSLADFILSGNFDVTKKVSQKSSLRKETDVEASFSPSVLNRHLTDADPVFKKLSPEQREEVRNTAECLLNRKCD